MLAPAPARVSRVCVAPFAAPCMVGAPLSGHSSGLFPGFATATLGEIPFISEGVFKRLDHLDRITTRDPVRWQDGWPDNQSLLKSHAEETGRACRISS